MAERDKKAHRGQSSAHAAKRQRSSDVETVHAAWTAHKKEQEDKKKKKS